MKTKVIELGIEMHIDHALLEGDWHVPSNPKGAVLFAHGSGSSRLSPRNRYVAEVLYKRGFATLLFDLLTAREEEADAVTGELRFNMRFLTRRLVGATDWLLDQPETKHLPIGYFGASTGGGAALCAAVERPRSVKAVVSRGGRPDMAAGALPEVQAATLLIVGERDTQVLELNEHALERIGSIKKKLVIVPGATHLFEETGALEMVAHLAAQWFGRYLIPAQPATLAGRREAT